ncbi:MAG: response regulator [Proteobacteria bacterium]|nr:response regulator [Pseudomonadota bacterium]
MDHYTTIEASKLLGMAVRSVQLMVDRGELEAWKTPGGHRRISRASIDQWLATRQGAGRAASHAAARTRAARNTPRILLIEDSTHFQNLVSLVVREHFAQTEMHVADDGIAGLAMYGQLQPDVLIVDILLPGIDGATLITSLRSHPEFSRSRLVVITSLDEDRRRPYAFALESVPVVHKSRLVADLPPLLAACLASVAADRAPAPAGA